MGMGFHRTGAAKVDVLAMPWLVFSSVENHNDFIAVFIGNGDTTVFHLSKSQETSDTTQL